MRDMSNIPKITFAPAFIASEFLELPPEVAGPLGYLQVVYKKPSVVGVGCCGSGAAIYLVGLMRRRRAETSKASQRQRVGPESLQPESAPRPAPAGSESTAPAPQT